MTRGLLLCTCSLAAPLKGAPEAGAKDFVVKPSQLERVLDAISKALG